MSPPKRSLFSLNLDSNVEHQHINEYNDEGIDNVNVFDTRGKNDLTNTFGNLVNKTVDGVLEGSNKKIQSVEGDLHTSTSKTSSGTSSSTLNIKNKSTRRDLERKYDTSEL